MDAHSQSLRPWIGWLLPLALLSVVVQWELWRAEALDASLRDAQIPAAGPVVVALLPEYAAAAARTGPGETASRPLFNPTRKPAPPKTAELAQLEVPRRQFVLVGTTVSPEGSVALLREASGQKARSVRKGDRIDGLLVVDIRPDRVKLAASGHSEDLLFKPVPSPPRPPVPATQAPAFPITPQPGVARPQQAYQTQVPGVPQQPGVQRPVANPAAMQPAAEQPTADPDAADENSEPTH